MEFLSWYLPPARLYYSIKLSMEQNEALTIVIHLAKNYVNIFHFSTGVSIRNYKFFSISSHRRNFVLAKNKIKMQPDSKTCPLLYCALITTSVRYLFVTPFFLNTSLRIGDRQQITPSYYMCFKLLFWAKKWRRSVKRSFDMYTLL